MEQQSSCLIIGAAGGIGRVLAKSLAATGWRVIVAGRRPEPLATLAAETGGEAVTLDARDWDAVDAVFAAHPDLTAVVNLAGSILLKPAHSTSLQEFDETLAQNLRTAFGVVRAAGKHMRAAGGSVVLMSSAAASIGLANHEAIAASKAAVEGLVRSAAATYASSKLRFNAVAPGLVDTPLALRLTSNEVSRKASESMHPLGRIGRPDEIAALIATIIGPAGTWITGQVFGIDGGLATVKTRG
jgi:NAD(P)-dependent dehydrogenase (short-subunit alcohol dehydrogenase family)